MCAFEKIPVEVQAALIEHGLAPWEAGLEPEDVTLPDQDIHTFTSLVATRADTSKVINHMNKYIKSKHKEVAVCQTS